MPREETVERWCACGGGVLAVDGGGTDTRGWACWLRWCGRGAGWYRGARGAAPGIEYYVAFAEARHGC
jgi:hypothetical protein